MKEHPDNIYVESSDKKGVFCMDLIGFIIQEMDSKKMNSKERGIFYSETYNKAKFEKKCRYESICPRHKKSLGKLSKIGIQQKLF